MGLSKRYAAEMEEEKQRFYDDFPKLHEEQRDQIEFLKKELQRANSLKEKLKDYIFGGFFGWVIGLILGYLISFSI